MDKRTDYYQCDRDEMLGFIPQSSKTILDVGCGEGNFGIALKDNLQAEVWGVELNDDAAKVAKKYLDKVVISDVFDSLSILPDDYFDCIVFNDSLEHLTNPYQLLNDIKTKLKPNGYIVCSIPNVRYIKNLYELLIKKDWRYRDEGILDFTHFRFFTKKSIRKMFESNDYEIITLKGINPIRKKFLFCIINILSFGLFSDSKYLQFAVVAQRKQINSK